MGASHLTRGGRFWLGWLAALQLTLLAAGAAETRYVWQESPNPTAPYTNWETAAWNIQEAVDAATPGETACGVFPMGSR